MSKFTFSIIYEIKCNTVKRETNSSLPAKHCEASDKKYENSVRRLLAAQYETSPADLITDCVKEISQFQIPPIKLSFNMQNILHNNRAKSSQKSAVPVQCHLHTASVTKKWFCTYTVSQAAYAASVEHTGLEFSLGHSPSLCSRTLACSHM